MKKNVLIYRVVKARRASAFDAGDGISYRGIAINKPAFIPKARRAVRQTSAQPGRAGTSVMSMPSAVGAALSYRTHVRDRTIRFPCCILSGNRDQQARTHPDRFLMIPSEAVVKGRFEKPAKAMPGGWPEHEVTGYLAGD